MSKEKKAEEEKKEKYSMRVCFSLPIEPVKDGYD